MEKRLDRDFTNTCFNLRLRKFDIDGLWLQIRSFGQEMLNTVDSQWATDVLGDRFALIDRVFHLELFSCRLHLSSHECSMSFWCLEIRESLAGTEGCIAPVRNSILAAL